MIDCIRAYPIIPHSIEDWQYMCLSYLTSFLRRFTSTCCLSITTNVVSWNPVSWRGVLNTTLCDEVCQWLTTGRWFSPATPASSTNKTDCYNITEISSKVALNITNQTKSNLIRLTVYVPSVVSYLISYKINSICAQCCIIPHSL